MKDVVEVKLDLKLLCIGATVTCSTFRHVQNESSSRLLPTLPSSKTSIPSYRRHLLPTDTEITPGQYLPVWF